MVTARRLRACGGGSSIKVSATRNTTVKKHQKKPAPKSSSKVKLTAATVPSGRPNTKSSIILQLLNRKQGATVAELATATSWQEHSVRGFMSGTLKKKLGLEVMSEIINGNRHYGVRGGSAKQ
jgi:Protein of unknown function (DUF3489)